MSSRTSGFPPIESLAFLSDGAVTALISDTGCVEWLCLPRMDGPSVFGAILDRSAGHFRIGPVGGPVATSRRYLPGSLVLETTWVTDTGTLILTDALTIDASGAPDSRLVRTVRCTAGTVQVEIDFVPSAGYGRGGPGDFEMWFDVLPMDLEPMRSGDAWTVTCRWGDQSSHSGEVDEPHRIAATRGYWNDWLASGNIPDGPYRALLERSALTLKGLVYMPTGAVVAAATTSLPETPGGSRNWDYRYTWIRDGVCTMAALQDLGFRDEAHAFLGFIADRLDEAPLQVMYGIGGELELPESTLDHLGGYEGAQPVRIGNGAVHQSQHDMWGWLVYLIERDISARGAPVDDRTWAIVQRMAAEATGHWRLPDQGIWEIRGAPRHFGSSKLMAWVALDRSAGLAARRGVSDMAEAWRTEAAAIREDLLAHGLDERGVFTQTYGAPALDASMLLVPLMGFLPGTDARVRATVLAIADGLTEHGLVLRYHPDEADDGVSAAEEGSFTICSFWLVSALARIGEAARARTLFDRLAGYASPLGLYAEEIDPGSGRHLGNMPQAFSHLALIGAALDLGGMTG